MTVEAIFTQPAARPYASRFVWEKGDLELVDDERIEEFNPYHDARGRFASKHGGAGALVGQAVDHYGVTGNIHEAGYITPDGRMLDFSGRHEAQGYVRDGDRWVPKPGQPDYLANQRNYDHRDAATLFPGQPGLNSYETHDQAIYQMLDAGFVRVNAHSSSGEMFFEVSKNLNARQFTTLARASREAQNVTVEKMSFNYATLSSQRVGYASNFGQVGVSNASILRQFTDISEALYEAILAEFNPHHDERGRFASKHGGAAGGLATALADIEAEIRNRPDGETIVVLDGEGKVLLRKEFEGDPDGPGPAVAGGYMTSEESALLAGATLTHNHPASDLGANGFSSADLTSAVIANPAEIRVVTKLGTTYSLKPPAGENFAGDSPFARAWVIQQAYGRENIRLTDEVMAGRMTFPEANWAVTHNAVSAIAKTFGWAYEVTGPGAKGPE